jgi:WD40 repeat protein
MRGVRLTTKFGLVLFLGLAVPLKSATTSAASKSQSQASGRILLATVVDRSGKTLVDFGVDDFLIQEAGDEREVPARMAHIERVAWSPDGSSLLAAGSDGKDVRLFVHDWNILPIWSFNPGNNADANFCFPL